MGELEVPPDTDRRHRVGRQVGRLAGSLAGSVLGVLRHGGRWLGSVGRTTMRVRADGADVPVDAGRLAAAFPDASAYVVIVVPGRDGSVPEIVAEGTYTAVRLRYDAARHISENGGELARLLGTLIEAWPVEVERIALVGHSTGGLVARSAVRQGEVDWLPLVRDVICTAGPHAWALREIVPAGEPGSTELRHGYLDEREWASISPGEMLRERRTGRRSRAAPTASRAGHWVGDLLVLPEARPVRRRLGWLSRVWRRGTGSGSG